MSEAAIDPALVWMDILVSVVGALVVGVLGVSLLGAICIGCAACLNPRAGTALGRSRYALALPFIGLALAGGAPSARAQTGAEEVPQIEPRYTRVFGSDAVNIAFPRVSPDGRWIVYANDPWTDDGTSDLWIISVDGGEPVRVTSGGWNVAPDWFSTSDRIAFTFASVSDGVDGVMTLPIDPETGAAAGPAQRVTLEPTTWPALVSPDGQWIAYRVWAEEGAEVGMALRVIPARGGTARTVMRLPGKPFIRFWSRDSRYIYFTWRAPDSPRASDEWMRVSIEDGATEEVQDAPTGDSSPNIPYLIEADGSRSASGDPLHVINTLDGRPVARVALPRNTNTARFASDGRHVVAVVSNEVSPIHVLPVAGGEARQLGDARADDQPIGWTAAGRRVIYQTQLDGRVGIMGAPVDGGAAKEYTVLPGLPMADSDHPVVVSESGRYVAYTTPVPESELQKLMIARAADGQTHEITDSLHQFREVGISGPGGTPSSGDEFIYLERNGEQVELRVASFDSPSRLLRTFPLDGRRRSAIGVSDDRVVWAEPAGDGTSVMLAEGQDGAPSELLKVAGLVGDDLVWSPDGRWIAASVLLNDGFRVMLLAVTPGGELASEPRFIEAQILVGWDFRWLPDGRALTIMAQSLPSGKTDVWVVPVREDEEPLAITRDETSTFWWYELSPDGRYIAYPGQIQRGSSLWLVDLGEALASDDR